MITEQNNGLSPSTDEVTEQSYSSSNVLKFIIPTILGVFLFLTPLYVDGRFTVMIAFIIDYINDFLKPLLVPVTIGVAVIPSIVTLFLPFTSLKESNNRFVQLFNPSRNWQIIRMIGAVLMLMVFFEIGPEWIWHRNTGGVMLYDVGPIVIGIYLVSAVLLPLITDYGFMEFIGTLISKVFGMLFRLPGRSAVDCLASWLSASAVGVMLTTQQYRQGYYTSRQSCIIATNFSIVSIAYAYLLIKLIGLPELFIPWYACVIVTGIILAIIVPKLPPLSRKSDTYFEGMKQQNVVDAKPNEGLLRLAFRRALKRADNADSMPALLKRALHTSCDVAISVYPAMMIVGCTGLALIEFTEVFQVLSTPLVPLLELLQLPEASKAAPVLLSGLVDTIMPSILGASIESELTRFVIAGVAVNQIVYLTEPAIVLVRAGIGLSFLDAMAIYVLRVLISLPILAFLGHLVLS